jgi:hypothetical protein
MKFIGPSLPETWIASLVGREGRPPDALLRRVILGAFIGFYAEGARSERRDSYAKAQG